MPNTFINKFYFIDKFDVNNIKNLDHKTSIIYRNYNTINTKEILRIRNICKQKKIKFYLANNLRLAIKYDCDGLYIPSFNNNTFTKGKILKKKFNILGSAHNIREIRIKELQGVEKLFISSIFKKNKNYLGIYRFKLLTKYTKKKIVALGGISSDNFKSLRSLIIDGFAGISYFKKKPPQKN
tara:strand:- start:3277 stop:3822 length:546 start_codon:yes stop_codon:yes gene_type:complete